MSTSDRRTFWLLTGLLGVAFWYLVGEFLTELKSGAPFADFFAFWSVSTIALSHPVSVLFHPAALHELRVHLGMRPDLLYPFAYPPTFLVLIWPLGLLPFLAAYALWITATAVIYLAAILPGATNRRVIAIAALLAPASTICIVAGQNGFLFAALLTGGARLARRRPVIAGILFGLLACKPQFGILVPVALLACGAWSAIAATCATMLILSGITALGFGWSVWLDWFEAAPRFTDMFFRAESHGHLALMMPTVLATSERLGVSRDIAWGLQGLAAIAAIAAVWVAWRRFPSALAISVLLSGTILATPYAFTYDMPILTVAILLFVDHLLRPAGRMGPTEVAISLFALAAPALMTAHFIAPVGAIAIGLILVVVLVTGFRESAAPG